MPVEIKTESNQLELFSEVGRESAAIQVVAPLPLSCFVGLLSSECLETASKCDQQ